MSTSSASGRREAAVARRAGVEIASENKISQPREPIDDVLRVDEKNIREYSVPNVSGVIITTNHKTNGIFLPADDRRHYVAWSDLSRPSFEREYWNKLWCWYNAGGDGHVAAYLAQLDLSSFDAKAPPPKTQAFLGNRGCVTRSGRRRDAGRHRRARQSRRADKNRAHPATTYSRAPSPSRRPSHNGSRGPDAAGWLRDQCWRDDAHG
jgi:hypothetical protein